MKIPYLLWGVVFCSIPFTFLQARENVTDWYIKDFRVEFVVHEDSTMTVTEWILADCGDAPDKHGIFRVVPTVAQTPGGNIQTPVELVSITDFSGKAHHFETTKNTSAHTLTWKIGEKDKVVTGENEYKIVYRVRNVIRDQGELHEWYWNVVGNFWELPIDAFQAKVIFPEAVRSSVADLSIYSGPVGARTNPLADTRWLDEHTLATKSLRGLGIGEGITLALSFPPTLFTPYQFSWWELYGQYLWFLIPGVMGVYLYRMWRRYGDDPAWDKPIIPEYEIPTGLNALTLGSLMKTGGMATEHITAALIELAVKGVLTIRQTTEKILFFSQDDFVLEKHIPTTFSLAPEQQKLLDTVFATGNVVKLSDLKHKFHPALALLSKLARATLTEQGLIESQGFTYRNIFVGVGLAGVFLLGFLGGLGWQAVTATGLTLVLFMVVGFIMPKRTLLGVETHAKVKGLKLYMETAEKYRQQFHEKEGVFETLLPVAILFGMTHEWIKKMEVLYGPDYFTHYHPAWLIGSFGDGFTLDSLTQVMDHVSKNIASNMGTNSGASGSGSSGGGGGGGGGGGW